MIYFLMFNCNKQNFQVQVQFHNTCHLFEISKEKINKLYRNNLKKHILLKINGISSIQMIPNIINNFLFLHAIFIKYAITRKTDKTNVQIKVIVTKF